MNKFYNKSMLDLKSILESIDNYNDRILYGSVFKYNNTSLIDLNFKYLVESDNKLVSLNNVCFHTLRLETMYDTLYLSSNKLKINLRRKFILAVIKLACNKNYFLPGKILNISKKHIINGYSIGICGFVGFSNNAKSFLDTEKFNSMFLIRRYDFDKKRLRLSKRRVHKIVLKILFKLFSKIIYNKVVIS